MNKIQIIVLMFTVLITGLLFSCQCVEKADGADVISERVDDTEKSGYNDKSGKDSHSIPDYFIYHSRSELIDWLQNDAGKTPNGKYMLDIAQKEGGIVFPIVSNSSFKLISGGTIGSNCPEVIIGDNAETHADFLFLAYDGENLESHTEKWQDFNRILVFIRAIMPDHRKSDILEFYNAGLLEEYYLCTNDIRMKTATVKKGDKDVTYLYCDCDPQYKGLENPFFEDRSFGFLIVDGKWLVIIELNAGYTGKPFEHKVMEWLDFETIKFTNP